MRVSGFTIARNAVKFDYPIVEAITSILPLCDEFIVAVGKSEDSTLDLIKAIPSDKIKILETVWDETNMTGGRTFAMETDKAFKAISSQSDWGFYIQADEVVHENDHDTIRKAMIAYKDDPAVDGLLFNYKHLYGSYSYVGESWSWYRREIRIVKNNKNIFSYRDAQGFRKLPNDKLRVKLIDAFIYHYGWVRHPGTMKKKDNEFHRFYHDNKSNNSAVEEFDYSQIDSLTLFTGTHPKVMEPRIKRLNWDFHFDVSRKRYKMKEKLKRFVYKLTGYRIGEYRNYKII